MFGLLGIRLGIRPGIRPRRTLLPGAVCLLFLACAPPGDETPGARAAEVIVLVSIDTLRSDHLPAYGYTAIETPAIDRLVEDGVLFERAYSPIPLTLPAHASLLTGLLPNAHGVRDNLGFELRAEELPYLPRRLREAGYATGAAVSSLALAGSHGLTSGFDFYDDEIGVGGVRSVGEAQRPGGESLDRAIAWLETLEGRPFFLLLHLYEPHTPYQPPPPFDARYGNSYDGEIAAADAVVGRLLEYLDSRGLYDRAAIVLTSDHGEGLGEHGEKEHGMLLYREALQVPLVLKLPERRSGGRRLDAAAQLSDLFDTISELAGIPPAVASVSGSPRRGRSLLGAIAGEFEERPIYAESSYGALSFGWAELVSVIAGDRHYVEARGPEPAGELFDLLADPGESENLVRRERRDATRLRSLVSAYAWNEVEPAEEASETRQALESLGYLTGGRPVDDEDSPRPDPRAEIETLESMMTGLEQFRGGDLATAENALRAGLVENPQFVGGWDHLARAVAGQGRSGEVAAVYREGLSATESSELARTGAELLVEIGELESALELVRRQLERAPAEPALGSLEIRLLLARGAVAEAARLAERGVEERPEDAGAHYDEALVNRSLGREEVAVRALERVLELDPRHVDALNDLAVARARSGRIDEAIALVERALAVSPDHALAMENLRSFRQQQK